MDISRLGAGFRTPRSPRPSSILDRGNPLSHGLFRWVTPTSHGYSLATNGAIRHAQRGLTIDSPNNTTGGGSFLGTPTIAPAIASNSMSIAVMAAIDATPGGYGILLGEPYRGDGTWTSPWFNWKFGTGATGSNLRALFGTLTASEAAQDGYESTIANYFFTDGSIHVYSLEIVGTTVSFYRDGVFWDSGTMLNSAQMSNIATPGKRLTVMNRDLSTEGEGMSGGFFGALLWSRPIGPRGHLTIAKDFWGVIRGLYV